MNKVLPKIIGLAINCLSYVWPRYSAELAVILFSTPRKGKLLDNESNYLKEASQKDIEHKGFLFKTYSWQGNGETILLVHGWESNAFRWKDLIEILKKRNYTIIAVDAPAHGASGNKTFNAILYSECIQKVLDNYTVDHVIGHSVGGNAAAMALNQAQKPIKKFVILGSPSNFDGLIHHYVHIMGYNTKVVNAMNAYFLKTFGHPSSYFCAANILPNILAEALIIHDEDDDIIPFKDALENKKALKNAQLIKTQGLGHRLRSHKVYGYILDFLNT